jgi:hypothetical protein
MRFATLLVILGGKFLEGFEFSKLQKLCLSFCVSWLNWNCRQTFSSNISFQKVFVNVYEPFTTISTTTRPIHASSFGTASVGEEFDVHRKVQLPFEVVMDFGPSHKRKKVVIDPSPILSKSKKPTKVKWEFNRIFKDVSIVKLSWVDAIC